MKGLVTKGIGGFYYIYAKDLKSNSVDGNKENTYRCRGKKSLKDKGLTLTVGDYIEFDLVEDGIDGDGSISKIYPRKNIFIRPPIANVDRFLIVSSCDHPKINFPLLDKFIITAEVNNTDPILCFNKCELLDEEEKAKIEKSYGKFYTIIFISCKENIGIDKLKTLIKQGEVLALAGASGVGKSTLINRLIPNANMETGKISEKSNRGKHTTRHVEMFPFGKGWIFDTPGFTSFNILEVEDMELSKYYPEIFEYSSQCKFDNCKHIKEPKCAVKDAVNEGLISKLRYNSYLQNIEELQRKDKYNG